MAASPTDENNRVRQARVHQFIEAGESVVVDANFVPVAAVPAAAAGPATAAGAAGNGSGASRETSRQKHSKSPSVSQSSPSTSRTHVPPDPTRDVQLRFEKQAVTVGSANSGAGGIARAVVKPSSLAHQLSMARGGLDDSNFPRAASMAIHKYTVFLPHEEGSMVQIAMQPTGTAHELVREALRAAKEENGGDELPSGLIEDPYSYRVHVAEEDGEVDTDFPVLDLRVNVASLGVESFVLRDRVDAAGEPNRTVRAVSVVKEGPGEDHSRSQRGQSAAFNTLETEGDDAVRRQAQEQQACCGGKCVIQ